MKKLLLAGLMAISFSAFSQSYIIMDNGMVITTDNSGFVYDVGEYSFPQKVTMKGGRYYVEDNSILATVDEMGTLFRKYEVMPEKILGKGINYYLSATGDLTTIDNKGVAHVTSNEAFTHAMNFGGTYFTVLADEAQGLIDLYTISNTGEVKKAELGEALKMKDVVAFGGQYFMTNRGVVFTITVDGAVLSQEKMRVGVLQKRGGNYFTDSSGLFYTVAEDGTLMLPALPIGLKVNTMTKLGSNYFLDLTGTLYTVDKMGNVYERNVKDQDFRNARIISL
jgi:hypothetical protein